MLFDEEKIDFIQALQMPGTSDVEVYFYVAFELDLMKIFSFRLRSFFWMNTEIQQLAVRNFFICLHQHIRGRYWRIFAMIIFIGQGNISVAKEENDTGGNSPLTARLCVSRSVYWCGSRSPSAHHRRWNRIREDDTVTTIFIWSGEHLSTISNTAKYGIKGI